MKGIMSERLRYVPPEEEPLKEVTEEEFLEFCYSVMQMYLQQADQMKTTIEQIEVNKALGKYIHYYKTPEGDYKMVAKRKPKLGFRTK